MKKTIAALMLLAGISKNSYAQSNAEKTFELPGNTVNRVFYINLEKGEKIKLEFGKDREIADIKNIDSLLRLFVQDIEPLKDSLLDDLKSKRIDYVIDGSGKNKIRLRQFAPMGNSYLATPGGIAALKLEQDTLCILVTAPVNSDKAIPRNSNNQYYRISFFLNNLANLSTYMNANLAARFASLKKNEFKKWDSGKDGLMYSKADTTLSANLWRGQVAGAGDYINFRLSSDIQNYKNYFVPSLSFGFAIVTNRYAVKREYSLMSESHFTFAKDAAGKLQTFRNVFLTLAYSSSPNEKNKSVVGFNPAFSIAWLARQRGNVYEKNSFRFGFGNVRIFSDKVRLEPVIYFHDFFKGVTPGIRLSL